MGALKHDQMPAVVSGGARMSPPNPPVDCSENLFPFWSLQGALHKILCLQCLLGVVEGKISYFSGGKTANKELLSSY